MILSLTFPLALQMKNRDKKWNRIKSPSPCWQAPSCLILLLQRPPTQGEVEEEKKRKRKIPLHLHLPRPRHQKTPKKKKKKPPETKKKKNQQTPLSLTAQQPPKPPESSTTSLLSNHLPTRCSLITQTRGNPLHHPPQNPSFLFDHKPTTPQPNLLHDEPSVIL